jgi:hypothetical protein
VVALKSHHMRALLLLAADPATSGIAFAENSQDTIFSRKLPLSRRERLLWYGHRAFQSPATESQNSEITRREK